MTQALLRKRGRDLEALPDSIDVQERKRFHGEETDGFLHLLQLNQTLGEDDEEDGFSPSEELVNRVMRSLEEEIATTCSTSYPSPNSGYNSAATDISSNQEGLTRDTDSGVDLCYLLEASDEDLGISPSPVLDLTEELCRSSEKPSEGSSGNLNLISLCENWHCVDDFKNFQQFELYNDV